GLARAHAHHAVIAADDELRAVQQRDVEVAGAGWPRRERLAVPVEDLARAADHGEVLEARADDVDEEPRAVGHEQLVVRAQLLERARVDLAVRADRDEAIAEEAQPPHRTAHLELAELRALLPDVRELTARTQHEPAPRLVLHRHAIR